MKSELDRLGDHVREAVMHLDEASANCDEAREALRAAEAEEHAAGVRVRAARDALLAACGIGSGGVRTSSGLRTA